MATTGMTAVIVGCGHRSMLYARCAKKAAGVRIVGVADPDPIRRQQAVDAFGILAAGCFETAEALAAAGKIADFVINGTMDQLHVATALPLLRLGYDMLLEKPISTTPEDLRELVLTARECGRTVLVCHVLRYAPFYATVKAQLDAGAVGQVMNIQTHEHVSYHHMAVGFVRGKWNSEARCHSGILMAKCCHDLDIVAWMKSGVAPTKVSSFGSRMHFREEQAPAGAGTRCTVDCPIERDCDFSARKHYIEQGKWGFYAWEGIEHIPKPTVADKEEWLRTGPYGRCVWKTDNTVLDTQTVAIQFADGSTAGHSLMGGSAKPSRGIHVLGTAGELEGDFESGRIVLRRPDPRPGHEYTEEVIPLAVVGDTTGITGGHGGGDERLVADAVAVFAGTADAIGLTHLEQSIAGHMIGFCAEQSRLEDRVVTIPTI